jgi:deoxyribonuclease-4
MLRFGPAGIPAASRTYDDGFAAVAALGLGALEVEFVHGVRMGSAEAARIGGLARRLDIALSAHAPYYVNLNSKDPAIVDASKKRVVDTMRACSSLGARIAVVHAGYYSGKEPDIATREIATRVAECREAADAAGCREVFLGLETMGRRASWGTVDEILEVAGRVDRVLPVLDFSHVHARCNGCLKTREDFRALVGRVLRAGPPFLHCHFSGIEFGPPGERRHLEVSSRSPDFALLAPVLLELGTDATIICESPLLEQDAVRLKEIVERTAGVGRRQTADGTAVGSRQS